MVKETQPCSILIEDRTTLDNMVDPEVRSRRQHSLVRDEENDAEESITAEKTRVRTITVGGVPLVDYLKMKKNSVDQKTTKIKRKRKKSPRRQEKTTPSVGSMKKIWEYMKNKKTKIDIDIEDNDRKIDDITRSEDNNRNVDNLLDSKSQENSMSGQTIPRVEMKKKFSQALDSTKKTSVSDRILRFTELERGDE